MTPQIHLHVLASGSKGNAAVVEGPAGSVLIDDGIARRTLLARASKLGVNMGDVRAVLLTHEHTDHVSGLPVFANHFDPLALRRPVPSPRASASRSSRLRSSITRTRSSCAACT